MKTKQTGTREAWLLAAIELMRPLFESAGYKIPSIRVACGWPSRGGLGTASRVIGQAWSPDAASDKIGQIFISPYLNGDVKEICGVLPTLVHEVAHEVVGVQNKHNKIFGKCARAVGLEGKLTHTVAGEKLLAACKQWAEKLGEYPHGQLDQTKGPSKKQSTRLIKCECPDCGYVCRTTRKWIDDAGAPICPQHRTAAMRYEIPDDLDHDEEGDE